MLEVIKQKLHEIEQKENVKIIYCVESGSRAWGFASYDSDYDVRFIYVRPKEFYLRLDETRDVIEWQLDEVLDINGWDLKKALSLLHKSNPTFFEWCSSPIIYHSSEEWESISKVVDKYFISKSGLYHYLNMAKNNYRIYLKNDMVRLKKYLYVLRPLLACEWILDSFTQPPMLFKSLVDKYLDGKIKDLVDKLLEEKMNSSELGEGKKIDEINEYIDKKFIDIENRIKDIPNDNINQWNELNEIFLSIIK